MKASCRNNLTPYFLNSKQLCDNNDDKMDHLHYATDPFSNLHVFIEISNIGN